MPKIIRKNQRTIKKHLLKQKGSGLLQKLGFGDKKSAKAAPAAPAPPVNNRYRQAVKVPIDPGDDFPEVEPVILPTGVQLFNNSAEERRREQSIFDRRQKLGTVSPKQEPTYTPYLPNGASTSPETTTTTTSTYLPYLAKSVSTSLEQTGEPIYEDLSGNSIAKKAAENSVAWMSAKKNNMLNSYEHLIEHSKLVISELENQIQENMTTSKKLEQDIETQQVLTQINQNIQSAYVKSTETNKMQENTDKLDSLMKQKQNLDETIKALNNKLELLKNHLVKIQGEMENNIKSVRNDIESNTQRISQIEENIYQNTQTLQQPIYQNLQTIKSGNINSENPYTFTTPKGTPLPRVNRATKLNLSKLKLSTNAHARTKGPPVGPKTWKNPISNPSISQA